MDKPIVCLTMIVKDEAKVIARCLNAIKGVLDHWVIVDTGSTDDTKEIVQACMKGIPGTLVDHPWRDYSDARNRALEVAEQQLQGKLAYAWVVDADDVWDGALFKENLTASAHAVYFHADQGRFGTTRFLRLGDGWRYQGIVEEIPVHPDKRLAELLPDLTISSPNDGASWNDPAKYEKRARLLSQALTHEPDNTRYAFYLAQSLRNAGDLREAALAYLRRAAMPGGERYEVYQSYIEAARCFLRRVPQTKEENAQRILISRARGALLEAYNFEPTRPEAPYELGRVFLLIALTTKPEPQIMQDYVPQQDIVRALQYLGVSLSG